LISEGVGTLAGMQRATDLKNLPVRLGVVDEADEAEFARLAVADPQNGEAACPWEILNTRYYN
jgi:hypothetical protein